MTEVQIHPLKMEESSRAKFAGARYVRLQFKAPFTPLPLNPDYPTDNAPKLTLPNQLAIETDAEDMMLVRISKCIYCGKDNYNDTPGSRLTDEHVVPRGLGGGMYIAEASCQSCQMQTGERTENVILNGGMLAPRRLLKIRRRRRKSKITTFRAISIVDGKEVKVPFSLDMCPSLLVIIGLNESRALGGSGGLRNIFYHPFNDPHAILDSGAEEIASFGYDSAKFAQMVAKIAHCYAISIFGNGNFTSYLAATILKEIATAGEHPEFYEFVGGDPKFYLPAPPNELHQLGHEVRDIGGKKVAVISIRLFANLGAPVFRVVAGEVACDAPYRTNGGRG